MRARCTRALCVLRAHSGREPIRVRAVHICSAHLVGVALAQKIMVVENGGHHGHPGIGRFHCRGSITHVRRAAPRSRVAVQVVRPVRPPRLRPYQTALCMAAHIIQVYNTIVLYKYCIIHDTPPSPRVLSHPEAHSVGRTQTGTSRRQHQSGGK